jgi:HlyD family secretion protein
MTRSRWAVVLAILTAGLTTGVYLARPRTGQNAGAIRTVRAERRKIGTVVNATGTVRLRVGSEVRVGAQLSGIVKKLNVTVGSTVRAGEVIAEIDDAPLQARLADADAQVDLDRTTLERARVNSDRAQTLASEGVIPLQQAQDLKLALDEADAKYKKSIRDRDLIKVDLNYVHIHAPISGIVASVSTQEGETVAASFAAPTFVTIIGTNALQLVAVVDETDIANVRRGNPVTFTVDSYPSHEFEGKVESVAPKATIISGVVNYEVTIDIGKDASLLKPDMTANVSIKTAEHEALVLPAEAVERDGDQTFVHVALNGAAEKRPVVTGNKDGGLIEIKKGITLADDVQLPPARQRLQGS